MEKIIEEAPWSYVCFEKDSEIFLTYVVQHGFVTTDYTVKLNRSEAAFVRSGALTAKLLVSKFAGNSAIQSRLVLPAIWPKK
ncbi:hypothetical protein [Flocculibacter collagenilyticus]|uniref:hypothetical protein n=1 Tax=Flocculibacter collagenilyticus TaxID=2744479 RepID=UPI0018F78828|nr:hypothetical protein [Flocculibacter collagenilyticus]